jgi:hypothetical protein
MTATEIPSKTKWLNVKAGTLSALGMIVFFLVMRAFNLHYILEFRFFNVVFLFFALLYTVRKYKSAGGEIGYLKGLMEGMKTTIINIIAFDIFFLIYLIRIDPSFMDFLVKNAPFGRYLNPWLVAGNIFGEGLSSGAMIIFILMQYYKSDKSETI